MPSDMDIFHNRTKIVCTLGPASEEAAVLEAMVRAGMDVARLNFSHGDYAWHEKAFQRVRDIEEKLGVFLAVVADLQGPRLRVGRLQGGKVELQAGAQVMMTSRPAEGTSALLPVDYPLFAQDVTPGQRVLIDDGRIELKVMAVEGDDVKCEVVNGGVVRQEKGINLPGAHISEPTLTDKDREDLAFALDLGVDYVALSFVRSAADVAELKDIIRSRGAEAHVIAKLERPEAVDDLDAIIASSDAVMVARGDLGVEMPAEKVPLLQKRIIARCMAFRKPVITATQMLDSMRDNPTPTRAEVTDVANAILDGTDAVMLSGETAVGQYPVQTVETMARIAHETEAYQAGLPTHLQTQVAEDTERVLVADAVARAAARTAEQLHARLIVASTQSGWTARLVSKCRTWVPVVASTPRVTTARRCALYWGVLPLLTGPYDTDEEAIRAACKQCCQRSLVGAGDRIVITAGSPLQPGTTNTLRVEKVVCPQ